MSWVISPARVHGPTTYYFHMGTYAAVRIGRGSDNGFTKLFFNDKHTIYPAPAQLLTFVVGATQLLLQPSLINGKPWWRAGNAVLYSHVQESGWIYSTTLKAGYRPLEWGEYVDDDFVYKGDAFYTISNLPTEYGATAQMTARGLLKTGADLSITLFDQPRWEGPSNGLGVYTPKAGATGDKIVGNARWKNAVLTRNAEPDSNGRYTYTTGDDKALAWNSSASAYVLGDYNSDAGWHQTTSAPTPESGYTLTFTKPVGSEAVGTDITGSWDRWVDGDDKTTIHLTEVAVMR